MAPYPFLTELPSAPGLMTSLAQGKHCYSNSPSLVEAKEITSVLGPVVSPQTSCLPGISEYDLIWKCFFAGVSGVTNESYRIRVGPTSVTAVLEEEKTETQGDPWGECHVTMKSEIVVMQIQDHGCQGCWQYQKHGRGEEGCFYRAFRESMALMTNLISDLQLPDLKE